MKKKVNGKVVEIRNIDLFKLAYEGKLLNKKASSKVKDTVEDKSELVRDLVNTYSSILESLVFPLDMVESPLKYTVIALILKEKVRAKHKNLQMQVDTSICVEVEDGKILRLLAGTWAIESTPSTFAVTTRLELEQFKSQVGYTEYMWAYEKLKSGGTTESFYDEFMLEFVDACKHKSIILKWELSRILDFGYVAVPISMTENRIVDAENNQHYYIDVYCTGKQDTNDKVLALARDSTGVAVMRSETKRIKVYNYETYVKSLSSVNNRTSKVADGCDGMGALFDVLLVEGIGDERVQSIKYTGILSDDILIFEVGKEVYVGTFREYTKPRKLISNVQIYSYENGRLYVKRRKLLYSKVYEEAIYSYEFETEKVRLCKISFTLG